MTMTDFVVDVTLTVNNDLQFTFNSPNRVVTMESGSEIIVRDKLDFIQVHNNIFQAADLQADLISTVNGVAFSGTHADLLSTVQAMADTSNGGAVVAPTGAGVDTWYYTNTLYTGGTKLNLTHQNYSETLVSDNLNLLFKNNADVPHDGTKFLFSENDIIRVSVLCKIDMNINSNLIRMRLRSRDGNYTMLQTSADTNVLELGQFLEFNFPPVSINAGTAANGFDVSVFDFTSQADAFAHSFKITIEKLGTNQ